MEVVGQILGGIQAGGQGAPAPGYKPGGDKGAAPVSSFGFGTPGAAGFQNAASTALDVKKQLEHPAWGVIDKMAGDPNDRSSFAGANPIAMDFLKNIFS